MANRAGQGRKPVPTALKVVRGTDQPCRVNKDEPTPGTDKIEKPPGLSVNADPVWDELCEMLMEAGVMTNVDQPALRLLCETYAQWIEANTQLTKVGLLIKGKDGGAVTSPYFHIADKLAKRVAACLADFGMNPSARTRVSIAVGEKNKPKGLGALQSSRRS